MTYSEERATKKIHKILSKLEPQAAARIARSMADAFAVEESATAASLPATSVADSATPAQGSPARGSGSATAERQSPTPSPGNATAAQESAAPPPAKKPGDTRPSFLQTEFRMAVGKELLDKEKTGEGSA